jgi:hypothetical protein
LAAAAVVTAMVVAQVAQVAELDNQEADLLVVEQPRLLAKVTLVVVMVTFLTIHTLAAAVVVRVRQEAMQLQIHNQVVAEMECLHIVLGEQQP